MCWSGYLTNVMKKERIKSSFADVVVSLRVSHHLSGPNHVREFSSFIVRLLAGLATDGPGWRKPTGATVLVLYCTSWTFSFSILHACFRASDSLDSRSVPNLYLFCCKIATVKRKWPPRDVFTNACCGSTWRFIRFGSSGADCSNHQTKTAASCFRPFWVVKNRKTTTTSAIPNFGGLF